MEADHCSFNQQKLSTEYNTALKTSECRPPVASSHKSVLGAECSALHIGSDEKVMKDTCVGKYRSLSHSRASSTSTSANTDELNTEYIAESELRGSIRKMQGCLLGQR